MSIKKIKQTGEDNEGVYNSQDALSFTRILNNNADELGTSTKLDLFYRNTPQAIRKALREQSERNINFHTPGGPDELATSEQTISEQKGGVAQIYNEALSGDNVYRLIVPDCINEDMIVGNEELLNNLYEYISNEDNKTWYNDEDDKFYAPFLFIQGDNIVEAYAQQGESIEEGVNVCDIATHGGSIAEPGDYALWFDLYVEDGNAVTSDATCNCGVVYRYTIELSNPLTIEDPGRGVSVPEMTGKIAYETPFVDYFDAIVSDETGDVSQLYYNSYLIRIVQGNTDVIAPLTNIRLDESDFSHADFNADGVFIEFYYDVFYGEVRMKDDNMIGIETSVEPIH